jgi:hypothetical protein
MADTYAERFGHPRISRHAMERMNTAGISPRQLADALATPAVPGTSPGTMKFIGDEVTAVVNEDGMIVTVYPTR